MKRLLKYDILRVVSSFSIVLLHVSASYWTVVDVHSNEFLVVTIYNSLTRFAVPVFFMLSGLFLVAPDRTDVAVGKRILRLMVFFYVWSAFYAFPRAVFDMFGGEFSTEVWRRAIEDFIYGHYHMWFLQTLAGFYLLIPVAKQICAKKDILRYYLILWGVFGFLCPCLTKIFQWATFQTLIDSLHMDTLAGDFVYFLLGYYLNVIDIRKEVRKVIYVAGIISLCMTVFLTICDSRVSDAYVDSWYRPDSLNILVMSTAIFIGFKYCRVFEQFKNEHIWSKLSRYTVFIYMFHIFVIGKLDLTGINILSFPIAVSIPMFTIFTFMVCLVGAFVADHIPVVKKIVMFH